MDFQEMIRPPQRAHVDNVVMPDRIWMETAIRMFPFQSKIRIGSDTVTLQDRPSQLISSWMKPIMIVIFKGRFLSEERIRMVEPMHWISIVPIRNSVNSEVM